MRRVSAVSSAIQTKDNEVNHLIVYCLSCIRHGRDATYEPGLNHTLYLYFTFYILLTQTM